MADSVNVCEAILDKKLEGYGVNNDDFKAQGELTVEITLSEYRKLVGDCATANSRIEKANSDKYERDNLNKQLQEQINALKAENYELKKALEGSKGEKEEEA